MGTSHGAAGRRPAYLIGRRAGPWERPLALSPTSPGPGVTRSGLDTAGRSCLAEPLRAPRPFPFSRVTWEPATGRRGGVADGWCPGLPAHPAGPRPPPCSFPQTHWTDSASRLAAAAPHVLTSDAWGPPSLAPLLFSLPGPRPPPRVPAWHGKGRGKGGSSRDQSPPRPVGSAHPASRTHPGQGGTGPQTGRAEALDIRAREGQATPSQVQAPRPPAWSCDCGRPPHGG